MTGHGVIDNILKEYQAARLEEEKALEERKADLVQKIPELSEIDKKIASLSVNLAMSRIKGMDNGREKYEEEIHGLISRKNELLESRGYSPGDLEIRYVCKKCKDTGYVGTHMCSCFKDKLTDALYSQSNFKELLRRENFRTFSTDYYSAEIPRGESESPLVIANKARLAAMDFVRNFKKSNNNIFITGATGTGKTFLTNCIVKELYNSGTFVIYLSAIKFFELLSAATFNKSPENDFISNHINRCDLLIIDDLGTEISNSFTASALFGCLSTRIAAKKHTIISTNLSLEDIAARYTERISSRIIENFILIRLLGDDIRIKKNLEA